MSETLRLLINEYDEEDKIEILDLSKKKKQNSFELAFNTFRGNIGAGLLAVPFAFKVAGIFPTILAFLFVLFCAVFQSLALIKTKNSCNASFKIAKTFQINTFGDLGYAVFEKKGRWTINFLLSLTQMGISAAYISFFGEIIYELFPLMDKRIYIFFVWIPATLLTLLKNFKMISYFSLKSLITYLIGILILWYFLTINVMLNIPPGKLTHNDFSQCHYFISDKWYGIFYAVSVAIYCFEGIGIVIPLQHNCDDTTKKRFPKIFSFILFFINIFIMIYGASVYMFHCEDLSNESITKLIPKNNWFAHTARILIGASLMISYVIQMYPILQITEDEIFFNQLQKWRNQLLNSSTLEDDKKYIQFKKWSLILFARLLPCICTLVFAISVPQFEKIVSIIGATACCLLLISIPSALRLKRRLDASLEYDTKCQFLEFKLFQYFVIILGIVLSVICTYFVFSF